ncbi:MAG: hypothetical protein ABGY72_15525 [bacterium]
MRRVAQDIERFESVHGRHVDVHEHEREPLAVEHLEHLEAVLGLDDRAVELSHQQPFEDCPDRRGVVCEEDIHHG